MIEQTNLKNLFIEKRLDDLHPDSTRISNKRIIKKKLNEHLKYKKVNDDWLYPLQYKKVKDDCHYSSQYKKVWVYPLLDVSNTLDVNQFPYRPDVTSPATFDKFIYTSSTKQPKTFPKVKAGSKNPKYVVLIPVKADEKRNCVPSLLRLFREESYGINATESKTWVKANLAVVIALNRAHSIDEDVNRGFLDQIENMQRLNNIAYRTFGFYWYFKWKPKDEKTSIEPRYSPEKSYLLSKCLNEEVAKKVRKTFEEESFFINSLENEGKKMTKKKKEPTGKISSILDMQKIRQRLLSESHTQQFLDYYAKKAPDSPRYLCSNDSDVISIRSQEDHIGLFKHYDNLILKNKKKLPSIVSPGGYKILASENPYLYFAIEIDMAVRKAMTKFFPAYFPEPNFAWHVKSTNKASDFSFIGAGKSLEALRLMQNAIEDGLVKPNNVVFGKCGAVTTTVANRWRTKKINGKKQVKINSNEDLQSLRSNKIQSHAFPRVWAEQIYSFLDIKSVKARKTDITKQLMEIYSVFHPISIIQSYHSTIGDSWNSSFKDVIIFYNSYIECMQEILKDSGKKKSEIEKFSDKYKKGSKQTKESLATFLKFNIDKMFKANAALNFFYDKSDQKDLEKIFQVAKVSGRAIYLELKKIK